MVGAALHYSPAAWVKEHALALKRVASFETSLTMALSVLGWLGCFLRWFQEPSARVRYLADASYWIYLAHLPLVVALQISLAKWIVPWWIQLPLLNLVAFSILLGSNHACVRFTWVGTWLNGRRYESG